MSGNSLRSHPDLQNDENVGDKQTEYIYSTFDVGRSMFDVHQFLFRFDRPYSWPAAGLTGKFGKSMTPVLSSGHTVFHNFGNIHCLDLFFFL